MESKKLNILVIGMLSSGSSALIDLFLEYNNINVIPGEFDDFRASRMVADQLTHQQSINFPNIIDLVIRNRSKKRLIYNIFPIFKFELRTITHIRSHYKTSLLQLKQLELLYKLNKKLKSDITFEEKIQHTNQWIRDIGRINLKNRKFIVFNQPIEIAIDNKVWRAAFEPFKLICVYRDPKDQLADIINRGFLSASFDAPKMTVPGVNAESIYGRDRAGAFKFHLDALRKRMEWVTFIKTILKEDEFLLIDFEGLINNYDAYKSVIEDFIGDIRYNHVQPKMYFDPIKSKSNIGIYKNILNNNELELLEEFDMWYKKTLRQYPVIQNKSRVNSINHNTISYTK